ARVRRPRARDRVAGRARGADARSASVPVSESRAGAVAGADDARCGRLGSALGRHAAVVSEPGGPGRRDPAARDVAVARVSRVVRGREREAHSKLKMSSSSGRCIPCSWCFSQIAAHGRPNMSGTSYSMTVPGETGVALPFNGKIVGTHSMKMY